MTDIIEIQRNLRDTHEALVQLERAMVGNPDLPSMRVMSNSLEMRRQRLEEDYLTAVSDLGIDVCSYRLFGEYEEMPIAALANSLLDFQSLVTTVYDAVKTGVPKLRAHVAAENRAESTLNIGYTFAGSFGVVLTLPNERLLFGESNLDITMRQIFELAKASDSQTVLRFTREIGAASVRAMYKWAHTNAQSGLGVQVNWQRQNEIRSSLLAERPEFEELSRIITSTSAEQRTDVELVGILVGADVRRRTFHLDMGNEGEITGSFTDAISESQAVELPKRYRVYLVKTDYISYSTDEETITYVLNRLESVD